MTTINRIAAVSGRALLVAGIVASGAFAMTLPSSAHAATYAFVNTSGDVSEVIANDPITAIATAFNIAVHSGVMLLVNQTDINIGASVGGV